MIIEKTGDDCKGKRELKREIKIYILSMTATLMLPKPSVLYRMGSK